MKAPALHFKTSQAGSFLLEALIAILIVALGILGSVGLLARSMQQIGDARNRGEAAFIAEQLIGQMWISDRVMANLDANFSSASGGANYLEFVAQINQRLPNATLFAQDVVVIPGPNNGLNGTNSIVTVSVRWLPPGDCDPPPSSCATTPPHIYSVTSTIGANQ